MQASRFEAAAAFVALAVFWGCGDARTGSPEPARDSAASEGEPEVSAVPDSVTDSPAPSPGTQASAARSTYHVPVPEELEPYSTFELSDLRLREHGGEWELEYTLPTLLVGGSQRLSFRGDAAAAEYRLQGDAGQLTCNSLGATIVCDEVLSRVELDRDELERSFAAMPAAERAARRAVAERFSDDPIGVLTFPR